MRAQLSLIEVPKTPRPYHANQWKIVCLREVPLPEEMMLCDTPERVVEYYQLAIETDPRHNRDVESFYVLMLNTRRKVIGFALVANGTLDTILVHPREVFRPAVISNAAAVILMHNHPSGDSQPSEADIKVTRDLFRAGQMLKIEVLDHIVYGHPATANSQGYASLRELGYFYE